MTLSVLSMLNLICYFVIYAQSIIVKGERSVRRRAGSSATVDPVFVGGVRRDLTSSTDDLDTTGQLPVWPQPSEFERRGTSTSYIRKKSFHFRIENGEKEIPECISNFLSAAFERFETSVFASRRLEGEDLDIPFRKSFYPPLRMRSEGISAEEVLKGHDSAIFERLKITVTEDFRSATPCKVYAGTSTPILQFGADERYSLDLDVSEGSLRASTVFGVLRGLETFGQLISMASAAVGSESDRLYAVGRNLLPLHVTDAPRFMWRGLLVDTSRHFYSIESLMTIVDGIAAMKLNTLHWHVVDSQSFPLKLDALPGLAEKGGAFGRGQMYSKEDVSRLVTYALARGVRIVPEIDIPAHEASLGIAFPSIAVHCPDVVASAPGGLEKGIDRVALHPLKEKTYDMIASVLEELVPLFPDNHFHFGGDEINKDCLAADPTVQDWLASDVSASGDPEWHLVLQRHFTDRLLVLVRELMKRKFPAKESNMRVVMWDEILDVSPQNISKIVVQYWRGWRHELLPKAKSASVDLVWSEAFYLDATDRSFDYFYEAKDFEASGWASSPHLLGGEACSWSESADEANVGDRIFKRLPAVAERLWSPASVNDVERAQERLSPFLCRLRRLGVRVGPIRPNFCAYDARAHGRDEGEIRPRVPSILPPSVSAGDIESLVAISYLLVGCVFGGIVMYYYERVRKATPRHAYNPVPSEGSREGTITPGRLTPGGVEGGEEEDEDDDAGL